MLIRTSIIAALLCTVWSVPLSAATLDEAIETCGKNKGNAKTCCTMLLDETDEIARCIRKVSGPASSSRPTATAKPAPPARPSGSPTGGLQTAAPKSPRPDAAPAGSYRIGATLAEFPGRSALPPEEWQPWKMELNPYRIKSYGATSAEAKTFEQKLRSIAAVVNQAPVLNPPLGCSPRLAPFLSSAYNEGKPAAKHEPLHGYLLLGCFRMQEVTRKKNGATVKERAIGETRQSSIYINSAGSLTPGDAVWYDEGTNGADPMSMVFEQPEQIGMHGGLPVYDSIDRSKGKNKGRGILLISRKNIEPYLPVNRERFLKALIHTYRLKREVNSRQLDIYTRQLAELTPTERGEQACLRNDQTTGWLNEVVAVGTTTCAPIVRVNPALFEPRLPRTTPQLAVVTEFMGTENSGHLNKNIDYWTTITALKETDWQRIKGLLDMP